MEVKEMVFKPKATASKGIADFLVRESEDTYHAKSKDYLSSHQLGEFRRNPLLFRKRELGLVPEEDRPAYLLGRAAHALILEGRDAFADRYAVGGPVNPKTGERYGNRTKAWQEWAEGVGKPVLTDEQNALIEKLHESVCAHKHACELFADGVAEGVVRADYAGVPCQTRLDWLNSSLGIVDLKTCDNLDWLQVDARSYGYAHQLAFYRALTAVAVGTALPVWLVAVEKREPFRCGVWRMGTDVLGIAQKENEEAIGRLVKCRATDTWPTGYEDVRVFDYL